MTNSADPRARPAAPTVPRHEAAARAPVAPVHDPAVAALQLLLKHERDVRQPSSVAELGIFIANEIKKLVGARQVFIAVCPAPVKFQLTAISSLSSVDRDAPMAQAVERMLARFSQDADTAKLQSFSASAYTASVGPALAGYPFPEFVFVPLKQRGGVLFAALLLAREQAWGEQDFVLLARLAETYAHAWQSLAPRGALHSARQWPGSKGAVAGTLLCLVALALVPVPMSALAPAEVVATEPFVVAAPIDGVIDAIAVEPSGLNHLKDRVQALELDAGVGGCKAPVGFGVVGVAPFHPGSDLALQHRPVGDTAVEALV